MKTIIKLIMAPIAAYFGLNWAADNPMVVKGLRNKIDQRAESGYEFALLQFKSYSSEPVSEPKNNKTKKQERKGKK